MLDYVSAQKMEMCLLFSTLAITLLGFLRLLLFPL
jgi:hypothetical protein